MDAGLSSGFQPALLFINSLLLHLGGPGALGVGARVWPQEYEALLKSSLEHLKEVLLRSHLAETKALKQQIYVGLVQNSNEVEVMVDDEVPAERRPVATTTQKRSGSMAKPEDSQWMFKCSKRNT